MGRLDYLEPFLIPAAIVSLFCPGGTVRNRFPVIHLYRSISPIILTYAYRCFSGKHARTRIQFSSEVWNPYFKMDIRKIENLQRRFTKAIFLQL